MSSIFIFFLFTGLAHKATNSPKSAPSSRDTASSKPSAPKSAPLLKTATTPKQTKKPEPIDHTKYPGSYFFEYW